MTKSFGSEPTPPAPMDVSQHPINQAHEPRITYVYSFSNGMTLVFDQFGQQMPNYQGKTADVEPKIMAAGFTGRIEHRDWTEEDRNALEKIVTNNRAVSQNDRLIYGNTNQRLRWRPFSTAPKDGRQILVRSPGGYAVVWWGDKNAADSEYGTVPHDECWGWLTSDGHNDPIWYRGHLLITEWSPIPGSETENVSGAVTGAVTYISDREVSKND